MERVINNNVIVTLLSVKRSWSVHVGSDLMNVGSVSVHVGVGPCRSISVHVLVFTKILYVQ